MRFELGDAAGRQHQWAHFDFAVGLEANVLETAVRGQDLVLRADRFLQHFLLDVDGFGGQLLFRRHLAAERV